MKSAISLLAPATAAAFLSGPAAWPSEAGGDEPIELKPRLVVTASRNEEDAAKVIGSLSVISAQEIRRSSAEDLLEILRLQPGIDIVRSGAPGAQTSVFLRGSNSNHVLVLIDGVRVASAHTGAYAWEQLPVSQIERIEIVRGPRASLWGSDAIGGVIQVFTHRGTQPRARVTGGSFRSRELETGVGFEGSRNRVSLHGAWRKTGGFSSQNAGGFSFHPDADALESESLTVRGTADFDRGDLSYLVLAADTETEFDQGTTRSRQRLASLAWAGSLAPGWEIRAQAGLSDDDLVSDYLFFSTGFGSRRLDLGWQNHLMLSRGSLAIGVDFQDESGTAANSYSEDRRNAGLYGLWDRSLGDVDLQFSLRLDDNSEFGAEWTYQAGLARDFGASGRLTGVFGTAFRTPSLSEQFSPGFGGLFGGNPLLEPESSKSLELIYRRPAGLKGALVVSAYRTEVDRLIAFSGPAFSAVNVNRVELSGLEIEYSRESAAWILHSGITLQNTRDESTGAALLRRPDRKAALAVDRLFPRGGWLGLDAFISASRLDLGRQPLPGYAVLSLRGGVSLRPTLDLEFRLENLLDRDYEPAAGFNAAGRSLFVSLNWRP